MSPASLLLSETGLEIIRGTSRTIEISIIDLDDEAVDIENTRIIMTVKKNVNDALPLIQKSTDSASQIVITSTRGGLAEIYLIPSDTHNLDPRVDYIFDVWIVFPSGERFAIIPPSLFRVTEGVTRIPI